MPFLLTINDIIARTGMRSCKFTIPGRELVDGIQVTAKSICETTRSRYIVLSLPKKFGQFMKIRPDLPQRSYRHGQDARSFVGALLRAPADVLADNHFVVIGIEHLVGAGRHSGADGDLKLNLFIDVDTDHPALVTAIDSVDPLDARRAPAKPARVPPVKMRVDVVMIGEDRQTASSRIDIDLMLMPMRNMPIYTGYAALDFGNTSTALVLSDTNQRDQFELVAADTRRVTASPKPVQTALRITSIKAPDQSRGFQQYEAVIGADALKDADAGWLVLGAKRLLSDRKAGAARENSVVLGQKMFDIPAEDPAEVFIGKMLQGMFFHRQCRPQSVAVTCPTTFTVSEVARLKRTVARAFLRATGGRPDQARPDVIDAFVPLVIDEASAAAFYFAYRDFIVGPGQVPAFRYLYPNGLHLLLYDCGGGTTDIALVRIEATSPGEVEIRVLGRAGHRRFGGDFITLQLFRLLKAKLAALKGQAPELPKTPAKIAEFLETHRAAIDRTVPTTFDLGQQQNEDTRMRRETTLHLWQLAESMKVRLSATGVREVRPDAAVEHANENELLNRVMARVGVPEGMEPIDVVAAISITRQEVDALIDPEIDETIGYANDLIRNGMEILARDWERAGREPPLEVPEVDRVYIVGNASRYPRVRDRLLDPDTGLQVRYLGERLADVRSEDLKNSVAKGAIVALRMRDMDMTVQVSWDEEFMCKLPFDMVGESFAQAGDSMVFRRGAPYSKELQTWRDIAVDPRSGRPTTQKIRLDRRWPGETTAEPYVLFQFDEPVAGRFVIRYDEEREAFVMHPDHKRGAEEMLAVAEPFEQAPYLAPPQSGRI